MTSPSLKLDELVDRDVLQRMVDAVSGQSGLRFMVLDPDGNALTDVPGIARKCFCREIRTNFPKLKAKCAESDRKLIQKLVSGEGKGIEGCWLGLRELMAPIVVREKTIGVFMVGGVLDENTTVESVVARLEEFGLATADVRSALQDAALASYSDDGLRMLLGLVRALAELVQTSAEEHLHAEEAAKDIRKILALSTEVGAGTDLGGILREVVEAARSGLNADSAGLTFYDADRKVLRIEEYLPRTLWESRTVKEFPAEEKGSLNGWVFQHQEHLVEKNVQDHPFAKPVGNDVRGIALAPLTVGLERLGVLWVESRTTGAFTEADGERLRLFATYSAAAIQNARTLEERDRFMELMTHQIVAPLGAIKRHSARLSEELAGRVDSAEDRRARSIFAYAGVTLNVALKFANVFRLLRGEEASLDCQPTSLFGVVAGQVDLYRPLARDAHLEIEVEKTGFLSLPPVEIEPDLVGQLCGLLLDNAMKYSIPKSVIRISGGSSEDEATVCVESAGLPIREDERTLIFKYEYRTKEARAAVPTSTGIGLAIAAKIMELHRGGITAESRPYGNAHLNRFTVRFPIRQPRKTVEREREINGEDIDRG